MQQTTLRQLLAKLSDHLVIISAVAAFRARIYLNHFKDIFIYIHIHKKICIYVSLASIYTRSIAKPSSPVKLAFEDRKEREALLLFRVRVKCRANVIQNCPKTKTNIREQYRIRIYLKLNSCSVWIDDLNNGAGVDIDKGKLSNNKSREINLVSV